MNLTAIDEAIRAVCIEAEAEGTGASCDWRLCGEEHLLREAALCIYGSRVQYELADAVIEVLRGRGLFVAGATRRRDYESRVTRALSEPVRFRAGGQDRLSAARFRFRFARMLAATAQRVYSDGDTLRAVLERAESAEAARRALVELVIGFGPKQASLYLRRIGYCNEMAVLDTHVLDYMHLRTGVSTSRKALARLNAYEAVEADFRRLARDLGDQLGLVDLATWITMRVVKREALL